MAPVPPFSIATTPVTLFAVIALNAKGADEKDCSLINSNEVQDEVMSNSTFKFLSVVFQAIAVNELAYPPICVPLPIVTFTTPYWFVIVLITSWYSRLFDESVKLNFKQISELIKGEEGISTPGNVWTFGLTITAWYAIPLDWEYNTEVKKIKNKIFFIVIRILINWFSDCHWFSDCPF